MLLRSLSIANLLEPHATNTSDPLVITPQPNIEELRNEESASIDLRLGTWFRTTRARRHHILDIYDQEGLSPTEQSLTSSYYVPFGSKFILHPRSFVLSVTLEWIRLPLSIAGMVTGKSSWGRRGLIIETAPGVHPGYSGCLTLELTNVGEIPIALIPGTRVCQLFLHGMDSSLSSGDGSRYVGQRRPTLGRIVLDDFAKKLVESKE